MSDGRTSDATEEDQALTALASLAEPLRRSLYEFVVAAREPVGRDEAAEAAGVTRQVAAYHLDKMIDEGLLVAEFRRLTGREGPGAGRPAKLYRRSDRAHEISIPPRRYELAARILLEAVTESGIDHSLLADVARRIGRRIGESGGIDLALAKTGYEPAVEDGEIRFRNCPFHELREQDRETTCGLNLALVEGMLEGAGDDSVSALDPEDGYCCVRLEPPSTARRGVDREPPPDTAA